MHRNLRIVSFLVIVATAAHAEPPRPITVGVSLPLTGDSAGEGRDIRSLLEFANESSGHRRFTLRFEDDRCDNRSAATIAQTFAEARIPFVTGFACSGALLAAAPIYEQHRIVTIGVAVGAPAISGIGDYIFRTTPSLESAAEKLYAHARKHGKLIAVLSEETAYAQGLAAAFRRQNSAGEIEILSESYLPNTEDFRAIWAKWRERRPDAIFLNPQSEIGMIALYSQILEQRWAIPIYATYYPGFRSFRERFGTRADGIVFADLPFLTDLLSPEEADGYRRFVAAHGELSSSDFYYAMAVSAFRAIDEAAASGSDPRSYLGTHVLHGPTGEFRFDGRGDVTGGGLTFVLKTLKDGKPVACPD